MRCSSAMRCSLSAGLLSHCVVYLVALAVVIMEGSSTKTVLVCVGERRRVVTVCGGKAALAAAAKAVFRDVIPLGEELIFQIQSDEWGGLFIDLLPDDDIPDKCVINAVPTHSSEVTSI